MLMLSSEMMPSCTKCCH